MWRTVESKRCAFEDEGERSNVENRDIGKSTQSRCSIMDAMVNEYLGRYVRDSTLLDVKFGSGVK